MNMDNLWLLLSLFFTLIFQVFIPGFPKETILLLNGANFGFFYGSILNWIGMILAAQVGYEALNGSVRFTKKYFELISKYHNHQIFVKLKNSGNKGLFILRLIPSSPNDILSLISGTIPLPRKGYIITSLITSMPYAVLFAYLGYYGSNLFTRNQLWTFNLFLIIITIVYFIIINYSNKQNN